VGRIDNCPLGGDFEGQRSKKTIRGKNQHKVGENATTAIVAQSPTSNHSVFKEKCFIIENNGKTLSENNQEQIMGAFHCLEVHIKVMTIKKRSQHSISQPNKSNLLFFPSKGLLRKT